MHLFVSRFFDQPSPLVIFLQSLTQEEGRNQKIQPEGAALEIRIAIATRGVSRPN